MEIDIRALEESVILFYRSAGASSQQSTHEWLQQAQCSTQAWSFSWELMQPGKPCEIQFFGATTLHSKLMKYWHEVPNEMRNELKQKLLETIVQFGGGPKLVLDRLCISLSAFIVHMLSEWPTAIEDIVNIFHNQQIPNLNENTQMWIMMEILCGIPEEANAIYTSIARVTLRSEINKRAIFVINTINQYIEIKCDVNLIGDDMTTMLKAVKCLGSWFKNGGIPLDNCQFIVNSLLKLINKCYWHNSESDGCMSAEANELTESCLETLQTIMIQPDANRYPNNALILMRMILDSLSNITKAEWKENNLNEDIAVGIYHLLISSIECHSRLLLSGLATESDEHKQLYMQLIQQVLECTDKPGIYPVEESCSSLAMGFWYMLQDEILSMDNDDDKKNYIQLIKPLYSHLTKILVRKSQQPNDIALERWSLDDLEAFRCYRQDISDTLIYCYEVLNDNILEIFYSIFQESLHIIQNDINEWPKLEACIFSFCAVAEHIDSCETKYLTKFMQILSEIPYKKLNEKVLGTSLETIGAYSEWFKENPNYIQLAIELLVKGLNSPKASQATLGLKDLTRECQKEMKEFAEPVLDACQQSLVGGQLKSAEAVRLMFSVGKLMSMLPHDKITICLNSMISPCFNEMYAIAEANTVNESSKIRVQFCLNMISTLFSSLNTNNTTTDEVNQFQQQQQQPVLVVMQKTMPILKKVGEIFIDDESIVKALCSALKYAMLNLVNDFTPVLPDVSFLILHIFRQTKYCAPAMEISRICITTYYRDEQYKSTMQELFYGITDETFKQFDQMHEDNFSDITELIETFYAMNSQIVKKIPMSYCETNINCVKLVCYGLKALTLQENGPIKYSAQFLSHFILQSRNYPVMTNTIIENGEHIIHTALMCIGEITPRTQVDFFADIFLSINKKYPSELIAWMKLLEQPNFPTSHTTLNDKQLFMKAIIREKVNKRLIQGQIREFSAKSRGIIEKI